MVRVAPDAWRRNVCVAVTVTLVVGLAVLSVPYGVGTILGSVLLALIIAAPYLLFAVTGKEVSARVWWLTLAGLIASTSYGLFEATLDAMGALVFMGLVPVQVTVVAVFGWRHLI